MTHSSIQDLSFEEALHALETVVYQLENGQIKLEEAVSTYERGIALKNHCTQKLQEAKLKVDKLILNKDNMPTGVETFDERPQR